MELVRRVRRTDPANRMASQLEQDVKQDLKRQLKERGTGLPEGRGP